MAAYERVLGLEHPDTLVSINNLAALYFAQRDWPRAAQFWRRSTAAIAGRTRRGTLDTGQATTGKRKSETEQFDWQFRSLVRVVHRLAPEGRGPNEAASREMFEIAQWALSSEAAQSLAQMAARGARGDPKLAAVVRERQNLVTEWQKLELARNAARGQEAARRDAKAEAEHAREKQNCPKTAWQRMAAFLGLRNGVTQIETRGGLANVSLIRQQAPLPETADELCAVARDIGADVGEMRLGARAGLGNPKWFAD